MKTRLFAIGLVFLVGFVAPPAYPQQRQTIMQQINPKEAMELGRQALSMYVANVLTERNVTEFGFMSLTEARSAELTAPYQVLVIEHKALKDYVVPSNAKTLFSIPSILWFGVVVNGETRTKIEMVRIEDRWIPGEFGGNREAQKISEVRSKIPDLVNSRGITGAYEEALVRVPFVLATFVFIDSNQGEFLVPAMVQPERFDLKNGRLYPATEVLNRLQTIAKEVKEGTIH